MNDRYRCQHDGLQWALYCEKLIELKGENKKGTGKYIRRESVIGYFPRFDQAICRMYELMLAADFYFVKQSEIEFAVKRASEIRDELLKEVMSNYATVEAPVSS